MYPFLSFLSLFPSYHKKSQKARRIDGLPLEILKGKKHFCFVKSAHLFAEISDKTASNLLSL